MLPTAALQTKHRQWICWRTANPNITPAQLATRWHTTPGGVSVILNSFRQCGLSDSADSIAHLQNLRRRLVISLWLDTQRGYRSQSTINLQSLARRHRRRLEASAT